MSYTEAKYQEVTDSIVASLEEALANGTVPSWVKPWADLGAYRNAFSNHVYRGINTLILAFSPFKDVRWATFNQIRANGGKVKKGSKGTQIILWRRVEDKKAKQEGKTKTFMMMRTFTVFNVEQTEGLKLKEQPKLDPKERNEIIDAAIRKTGVSITEGGMAAYSPTLDRVEMPAFSHFKDSDGYYSTMMHELTHWTGHKDRLNRELSTRFGSQAYAAEELVAELGSSFLCRDLGVNGSINENTVAYIASWIKVLKSDVKAIFKAATLAEAAAKYIKEKMEITEQVTKEDDEAEAA